jgi:hypothetical protein
MSNESITYRTQFRKAAENGILKDREDNFIVESKRRIQLHSDPEKLLNLILDT